MSMLPRLAPTRFYDLVIEVAIDGVATHKASTSVGVNGNSIINSSLYSKMQ
jgi:hypothetical protein